MIEGHVIAVSEHGIRILNSWFNGPYPGIKKGDYVRIETEGDTKKMKSIMKVEAPPKAVNSSSDVLDAVIDRQIGMWKKLSEALEKENWLGFQSEDARQKILTSLAIEMNRK